MALSLDSHFMAVVIAALVGLLLGLLMFRGGSRRRIALGRAELGQAKAEIETRDARIASLERELAQARDQVRPLSDEVDRFRREAAQRKAAIAGSSVDLGAATAVTAVAEPVPSFLEAPQGEADDLTVLKGVGERFAAKLNELGVFHVRQIAGWSPEEARSVDAKLDSYRGRVERDQLVEQARLLAAGRTTEYEARFGKIGS